MKFAKTKLLGITMIVASLGIVGNAQKKSQEDYANQGPACLVLVEDGNSTKYINTQYIRLLHITTRDPEVLRISMASNYSNGSTDNFNIKYNSKEEAINAMRNLNNSINDCSYEAAQRRKNKP